MTMSQVLFYLGVFIDCLAAKLSYGQRKVRLFRLKVEYFPTFFRSFLFARNAVVSTANQIAKNRRKYPRMKNGLKRENPEKCKRDLPANVTSNIQSPITNFINSQGNLTSSKD